MTFDNQVQQIVKKGVGQGVVLNAWNGRNFEEYATTNLDSDHLLKQAEKLGQNNRFLRSGKTIDAGTKLEKSFPFAGKIDPRTVPLETKISKARELQQRATTMHSKITNTIVRYIEKKENTIFVNPARTLDQIIFRLLYRVDFLASHNGRTDSWMTGFNGSGGFESVTIPEEKIENALRNLLDLLSAETLTPGTYDAIVDPETSGVIVHEAFGHGVENDVILKNRSRAKQYMGKPVGSNLVNMTDNPLKPGTYGIYYFDDEGQLAEKTVIIENGILKQGLSDQYSSIFLDVPDLGNGRRENFTHKPFSRMSNTYLEPGEIPLEQMVSELDDGIFIIQGTNGMEDPKNWGIQCEAKMAREVKNEKFTGKNYAPIGLTGYVPDLLQSITSVSSEFQTDFGGTCIKGYKEHVPVSVGGPYVKIRGKIG